MKNQGENKNKNKFDPYKFIIFIADLRGPFFIMCPPPSPPAFCWGERMGVGGLSLIPNFQKVVAWKDLNF